MIRQNEVFAAFDGLGESHLEKTRYQPLQANSNYGKNLWCCPSTPTWNLTFLTFSFIMDDHPKVWKGGRTLWPWSGKSLKILSYIFQILFFWRENSNCTVLSYTLQILFFWRENSNCNVLYQLFQSLSSFWRENSNCVVFRFWEYYVLGFTNVVIRRGLASLDSLENFNTLSFQS